MRDRATLVAFLVCALLAGGNAVAVRFSNHELAPLWGATLRFAVATAILLTVVAVLRLPLPRGRALVGSVLYGLLAFAAAFFTHGDYLVPVVRTIVWSSDGRFGLILSPGRVWSEPGDQGMSRASFPFVLVNPIDNSTHNGLASFVFDDTRVSHLRVQITQETARWSRDDYWGQVPLTYTPGGRSPG